ncbi:GNAT family N-acetyltransferase [Paraburkholderia sp. PREW-6R]|uniref:GNAT family N-acetyltransferase n=1 Tax=Paraburkholderia sp. PREW-6R TaxID=3141544 RepID=UPI0031F5B7CB
MSARVQVSVQAGTLAAVTFRLATPDDAQAIRAIEFEAGQRFLSVGLAGIADAAPMDLDFVNRKIQACEILLAIDVNATCAGFVMFEAQPACFYVQELDVLTSHAGRRIGAALIEQVAQLARERKKMRLRLSTFRDVPWNAPYYRRLGFRDMAESEFDAALIALRDAHIARGLDESRRVFMQRDLVQARDD